jgi:hypothetical protein
MVVGDFMSVYYSSDHRGYYSATENDGGLAQKKVSPAILKHMVRKRTSFTPLNKQMSPCAHEDGLQSSSGQTNQPFKTVKCDVLKDMSNVLRDIIKQY